MDSNGESDMGADASADAGADAGADSGADEGGTADDGAGATDGATADFDALDAPHPATSTAAIATPTAMRAAVRTLADALTLAFIVGDGDGGRVSMQSR